MKFLLQNNQTGPGVYKKEILFYRYYKVAYVRARVCACDVRYDFFMAGHHVAIFFFLLLCLKKKKPLELCFYENAGNRLKTKKKNIQQYLNRENTRTNKEIPRGNNATRYLDRDLYKKNRPKE